MTAHRPSRPCTEPSLRAFPRRRRHRRRIGAGPAGETAPPFPPGAAVATFAGGCFSWCMEASVRQARRRARDQPRDTRAARKARPSYEGGVLGHHGPCGEAVQVLLRTRRRFPTKSCSPSSWHNIDPTVADRQFLRRRQTSTGPRSSTRPPSSARGPPEASKAALEQSKPFKDPIVTTDRDGDPVSGPARGIPPGLLQKESDPLQTTTLPDRMRPAMARLKQLWGQRHALTHRHGNEAPFSRRQFCAPPATTPLRATLVVELTSGNLRVRRRFRPIRTGGSSPASSPWSFFFSSATTTSTKSIPAKKVR